MINTIKQALENSFSFADYRKKVTSLIAEGKSTGHTQSEDLLKYSELNETRMNRLEKNQRKFWIFSSRFTFFIGSILRLKNLEL